jgi:hypothetical protein
VQPDGLHLLDYLLLREAAGLGYRIAIGPSFPRDAHASIPASEAIHDTRHRELVKLPHN